MTVAPRCQEIRDSWNEIWLPDSLGGRFRAGWIRSENVVVSLRCRMLTIAIFCSYYCTGGQNPPQHTESVFLTKFRPHLALAFLFDFGVCRRANFLCKVFFLWYSYKIGNMRLYLD